MEKLTINIPETKSALVKQLLKELGVVFQSASKKESVSDVRAKLANISVWSDKDMEVFEENKQVFDKLTPPQW
ncbi:hypothetical protein [Sphingobacterium corticibacterium]|uniref:Uncharacterized protein n=1 Tax=Sphingobacterium corticibacterium TaxID=2484746 RepID=A0A4Q6XT91_9SPHI|nr:hypothetical protein [Sphingobacterium corticibacterium]RZF59787.1 hypothetical protein EWE74_11590 [Sphingobacterium corticibacterium]